MKTEIIVIDQFYNDPQGIRDFALAQPFSVEGTYFPGYRTVPHLNDEAKTKLAKILKPVAGEVVSWDDTRSTGAFQISTEGDSGWVHYDADTSWAAVCYLTPNAPPDTGTSFFRHKEFGDRYMLNTVYDPYNKDIWEEVDRVGNVFNRLVLYRSTLFHRATNYFGKSIRDGRLFQVFFIKTEV
jgi:hypothetical protein